MRRRRLFPVPSRPRGGRDVDRNLEHDPGRLAARRLPRARDHVTRVAVVVTVVVAALVALQPGSAAPRASGVDDLTLEQQVGQLLVLRFRGETPPDYVRRA